MNVFPCSWCGGSGAVIQTRNGYYGSGGDIWVRLRCKRRECSHEWDEPFTIRPAEYLLPERYSAEDGDDA